MGHGGKGALGMHVSYARTVRDGVAATSSCGSVSSALPLVLNCSLPLDEALQFLSVIVRISDHGMSRIFHSTLMGWERILEVLSQRIGSDFDCCGGD